MREVLGGIIILIIVAALMAFPTMWLWNWLMPTIFSLREIDVYEALGLCVLFRFLIGSGSSSSG